MLSLRRFWPAADREIDPADLMRVVRLLLQGIALHAVEGAPLDYKTFRRDIQRQSEIVEANPGPAELLVSLGSILQALEHYNSRTTLHLRTQKAELQQIIALLTRAVTTLASGSEEAAERLREIEAQIEKAPVIEEVGLLRLRMAECLDALCAEAKRKKTDSSRAVASLREEVRGSRDRLSAAGAGQVLDPITGLPARPAAAAALAEWAQTPNPPYAGLFVVDRVAFINARFGQSVGDRVLKAYVEDLRSRLPPGDPIFRWSGPAFLALLHRPDRIEEVREQLRVALPGKTERNFELENRSVLLSISATCTIFPITLPLEELIEQFDSLLVKQDHPAQA